MKIMAFRLTYMMMGLVVYFQTMPAYASDDLSDIFSQIRSSFAGAPDLLEVVAYLTALIMAVMSIIKLKDHFENPSNNPLREAVARALIAGALFALPTIVITVTATIAGTGSDLEMRSLTAGGLGSLANAASDLLGIDSCDAARGSNVMNNALNAGMSNGLLQGLISGVGTYVNGGTLGEVLCYGSAGFKTLPGLIAFTLYVAGLFLVVWGLLQLRDHLLSPDRNPVSVPLKKLLLAGAFFSFPGLAKIVQNTVGGDGEGAFAIEPNLGSPCAAGTTGNVMNMISTAISYFTGSAASKASNTGGLDCMMVRLITDVWNPILGGLAIFAYLAGIILIALALRRMMDNMDKGVKSPVGIGTVSMILIGGALLSFDTIIRSILATLFPDVLGVTRLRLYGSLSYIPGVGAANAESINSVITTVFAFAFIVGTISVLRGLFMLKEVANGGNASMMAAFTHIIGGGLALNLGATVSAIQNTLGIQGMGITANTVPGTGSGSFLDGLTGGILGQIGGF